MVRFFTTQHIVKKLNKIYSKNNLDTSSKGEPLKRFTFTFLPTQHTKKMQFKKTAICLTARPTYSSSPQK